MNMTRFIAALTFAGALLAGALLAGALLAGAAAAQDQAAASIAPLSEAERAALSPSREMIELGRSVADKACAECHGMNGVGGEPGQPHLAGQRTAYLHRVLQSYEARERHSDVMNHATGILNDEALLAVSAYYANLAPAAPAPAGDGSALADQSDPFSGIRDEMKKCVKCHGEDGNSTASGMPNLTAQQPEYFVAAMNAYVAGGRDHKLMKRLVADLDEQAIAGMAVFYAVQPPARSATTGDGEVEAGRAAAENCANCHGADGNASGSDMPTLAGQDARYFVKAMGAYRDGSRRHEKMFEAVSELGDEDIANLATFYAAQEPVRRNVRTPLTTSQWIDRCERCHGIDGNSTDPRFPMLAGQDETYLAAALEAYAGRTRNNRAMHAMSAPLNQADIAAIARHYSTQTPKSVVYMQLPCADNAEQ
jgi:cytochrome c553